MDEILLLDGATGTMLQAAGLPLGKRPEIFGMEHPELVEEIQRRYVEAGSQIIYANTFGANAHKLAGFGVTVEEVIAGNVASAKKAAKDRARVALDVGPIGELLEPLGTLSFEEAYELYREMVVAGEKAGVDLVVFETMTDLYEVKAAVLAAKENTSLPVWVTMSFEASGRTFSGTKVACMAAALEGLGVDAMGINCSLGPKEIYPLICTMKEWTDKPIIVKPNAGLPDPATGAYEMDAEEFQKQMEPFVSLGVSYMGGCCGTTPAFIKTLGNLKKEKNQAKKESVRKRKTGICSSAQMTELDGGIRVIGERINPTGKKRFQQALREGDLNYIMECAIEEADGGADILDINVGMPGIDEKTRMEEVVRAIQSVVTTPLQIDSSDPEVIEAGLRICNGVAIVNSVNAEEEKLHQILPLVKKYGAAVIGLTMDQRGIPQTGEERFALAETILQAALSYGIPREKVLIDCLTLTISAQQNQAAETLKAVKMVREKLGLHCVLGVSNISFGLPERKYITVNFLIQAMHCGVDLPIVNPNQTEVMDAIASFRALSGEDENCTDYIGRFAPRAAREKEEREAEKKGLTEKLKASSSSTGKEMTLELAVSKGLSRETALLTESLFGQMSEMEIINEKLIPALDLVGERYEKQEIFLPQLIQSANAACAGFEKIKERLAARGDASIVKGRILLATVEGDIHDIGKNIVRVVLENYGFQVLDLGRDVPVQKVVETAIREQIPLIGLSALMTTTVTSMRKTIAALRDSGHPCKIMVGGAVLTEEYAKEMGADFYARDAKASADIAKAFFAQV